VTKLLLAGIIPGLLTATVYMIMIVARAMWNPAIAPPIVFDDREALWKERWASLAQVWPVVVLIIGVMGGLYTGVVTPTEGGAAGALLAIIIGFVTRQLSWAGLVESFKDAIGTTAQLFFVGMGAVIFTKFLALAGASTMFTEIIGTWALEPLHLVIGVSFIYLILGMFLDPLGMVLLTIPVFVPMFNALGLDLVWLGVLVVKYIGIGLLTPPVGFNVYVVKNAVGDSIPLETIFRGCFWFLGCEIVIMTLLIGYPELSLWLPNSME
jgi:C4-dicarboxylate transporter DctM subunit